MARSPRSSSSSSATVEEERRIWPASAASHKAAQIEDRLTALDIHGFSPVRKFLRGYWEHCLVDPEATCAATRPSDRRRHSTLCRWRPEHGDGAARKGLLELC